MSIEDELRAQVRAQADTDTNHQTLAEATAEAARIKREGVGNPG